MQAKTILSRVIVTKVTQIFASFCYLRRCNFPVKSTELHGTTHTTIHSTQYLFIPSTYITSNVSVVYFKCTKIIWLFLPYEWLTMSWKQLTSHEQRSDTTAFEYGQFYWQVLITMTSEKGGGQSTYVPPLWIQQPVSIEKRLKPIFLSSKYQR